MFESSYITVWIQRELNDISIKDGLFRRGRSSIFENYNAGINMSIPIGNEQHINIHWKRLWLALRMIWFPPGGSSINNQ